MSHGIFSLTSPELQQRDSIYQISDFFRCKGNNRVAYVDEDDPILNELIAFRRQLLDQGYEPIPVRDKNVLLPNFTSDPITAERIADETRISTAKLNTGLRTGLTVGVDNDLRDPEHARFADEVTESILGPTPLKRVGSKGAMSVYRNQTPIRKITITDRHGARLYEVLGQGQQFVAFGQHPLGMDYHWEGASPSTVKWSDLPEVTPEQLTTLRASLIELFTALGYQFRPEPQPIPKSTQTRTYSNDNEDIPALCRAALAGC